MPMYRAAFQGKAGTNTANTYIGTLWTPTRKARVREVACFIQTVQTTAPLFALSRATARGSSPTGSTPLADDPGDIAATAALDTGGGAPTFSTTPFMVGAVALAAGNGYVFGAWDNPIEIAIAAGLTLFNVNATGATPGTFALHFIYEE